MKRTNLGLSSPSKFGRLGPEGLLPLPGNMLVLRPLASTLTTALRSPPALLHLLQLTRAGLGAAPAKNCCFEQLVLVLTPAPLKLAIASIAARKSSQTQNLSRPTAAAAAQLG